MSVKFPDILQHENSNYAVVDINDVRGIYIIESLENLLEIPYDKRKAGSLLSIIGGDVYSYGARDLDDSSWGEAANWHPISGASGDFNGVAIYGTTENVKALTYEDNKPCVYCVESQQIYKYFKDGSQYTVNPPYIIQSADLDGNGRYVSLFYLNANQNYTAGTGILIDSNTNTISADFDVVAKKDDLDEVSELLNETAELLNDTIDDVEAIEDLIPNQASTSNQLADKDFVNSSIENMAARYITYDAEGNPFPTYESLMNAEVYYFNGHPVELTMNDYTLVYEDEEHPMYMSPETYPSTRYIWTCETVVSPEIESEGQWNFQYIVNNTPFTSDQYKAINSGITNALVEKVKNTENCVGDGSSIEVNNHVISVMTDKPINESLTIYPTWTNDVGETSDVSSYSAEEGDTISLSAKFKWTTDSSHKDPKTASGISSVIPESGEFSETYTEDDIKTSKTFSETFSANSTGLVVNAYNKVVYAEGNDQYTKSISVTFKNYRYYGGSTSSSLTSDGVKGLPEKKLATKGNINNEALKSITVDNNTYFYYAYPSSFGKLSKIYQNGVLDVLDAFTYSTVSVTNFHDKKINYYVYRSKQGAFTDKTLTFVF